MWSQLRKEAAYHPKYDLRFIDKIMAAKEGTIVGVLGDFFFGNNIREMFKDILDTPILILNRVVEKGKIVDTPGNCMFRGATGTFNGRVTIFVSNKDSNTIIKTLVEEAVHVLQRQEGDWEVKRMDWKDPDWYKQYKGLPQEVAAEKKFQEALDAEEDDEWDITNPETWKYDTRKTEEIL